MPGVAAGVSSAGRTTSGPERSDAARSPGLRDGASDTTVAAPMPW